MTSVPVQPPRTRWLLPTVWLVLTLALAFALPRLPWSEAIGATRRAHWGWIAAAVLANLAILPLWALEWRLLVGHARTAFRPVFDIVAVTASVLNSVPMLAGELSAVAMLINQLGLTRGAAISVLAMDQLLVAFAKLATIAVAAALAPLPSWLTASVLWLVGALGAGLLALVPLAHRWQAVADQLRARRSAWATRAADLASWGEHLHVLRRARILATVACLALLKKGAELSAIVAVQIAFGLDPMPAAATLVLAALAISTLVPVAPANLGVYEATVFAVYRYAGVSADTALGLALVQHLCFLLPSVATGYVVLTARQLLPARK